MTLLSPSEFKEEFKARVTDFVISGYLLNSSNRKPTEKEKIGEEMYLKLEKWVMDNITVNRLNNLEITPEDTINSKDQGSLDF